jgi:hypothetical protein
MVTVEEVDFVILEGGKMEVKEVYGSTLEG